MKVIGFAGFSGSGKTTLIERLVPELTLAGKRVSLIKHAHHAFDVDTPGKDSYRVRTAGCTEVLVVSEQRWALMHELRGAREPSLEEQIGVLSPCDFVLVEGYKHADIPKIEVHRAAADRPLLYPTDPRIVAVATDEPLACRLPQFALDDVAALARFIIHYPAERNGGGLTGLGAA